MSSSLPPLNALRVFECAARHMSFTEAALELHISQSAVSHQVKTLEEWVGFRLFERNASRLTLTQNGKVYADVLTGCFSRITAATQELVSTGAYQILNLRGYAAFFTQWLIPRLSDFQNENPDIKLRLHAAVEPVDFKQDHVDMGIVYASGAAEGVRSDLIFADQLIPVMSPRLAEQLDSPCSLERLFALPFLHSRLRDQWSNWIEAVGGERQPAAHDVFVEDVSILYRFALEGLGVALTQLKYAAPDLKVGRIVAPHPFILRRARGYHLVCPEERADEDKILRFRRWLLTRAAEPD